ncbi:APC family permease [Companilactobacillus mishanensis]|uniref:Amino acid permease n=1 Tax=Companilactobacillus mishanensis TaxID=2486008 RepID=A0ABW9P953_9LACO|nr:APC family permease [Companilactobacillus mishanensis]MQS45683.1 amino acid permease [Companilactobacillus mishanensis]
MKGKFGTLSVILLGINSIIGSGIFLLPGKAEALMGPASILVFIFDMLLIISIALCYAEDATYFEANGGPYLYAKKAFGNFIGYEVGFSVWAISIIAWATMSTAFATALGAIYPVVQEPIWRDLTIILLLGILTTINILGVTLTKVVNNIVTIAKLLPLVIFVIVGLFFINGANFTPFVPQNIDFSNSFGSAAILIFYAFTGFEAIAIAAQEFKNPQRTIPLAIVVVLTVVALLYILIQVVSIGILGGALAGSNAPIQEGLEKAIGPAGKAIVAIGTLVSILGVATAQSFYLPRIGSSMADNGVMPKIVGRRNQRGVPFVAMLVSFIIAVPLALSGTFQTLAAISVVSRFAQYIPTILAVLVFRKKLTQTSSKFRIPLGPTIPVIAVVVSFWLLTKATGFQLIMGLGCLVIAVPFYFLNTYINKKEGDLE